MIQVNLFGMNSYTASKRVEKLCNEGKTAEAYAFFKRYQLENKWTYSVCQSIQKFCALPVVKL